MRGESTQRPTSFNVHSNDNNNYIVRDDEQYLVLELPEDEARDPFDGMYDELPFCDGVEETKAGHPPVELSHPEEEEEEEEVIAIAPESWHSFNHRADEPSPRSSCWCGSCARMSSCCGAAVAANPCVRVLGMVIFASLPVFDAALDLLVAANWYFTGKTAYFWLSIGIFASCVLMTNVIGSAAGSLGVKLLSIAGFFPLSLMHAVRALARGRNASTTTTTSRDVQLTLAVLGQIVCETVPQVALQSYMLIREKYWTLGQRSSRTMVLTTTSLLVGMTTMAAGFTGIYFRWERPSVKIWTFLFLFAMVLARCGAYVTVFVEFSYFAIAFPVAHLVTRVFALVHFKVVALGKIPVVLFAKNDIEHVITTVEDELWTNMFGAATAVTSRLHSWLHDAICLSPFVVLLTVFPFGARIDPALHHAGVAHRYEGLKRLFAFGGSAVDTFRNRLVSDLAIFTIMLHAGEDLIMILVASVSSFTRQGHTRTINPLVLSQLCFVPLAFAPLFFFAAFKLVGKREAEWSADLDLAKKSKDLLAGPGLRRNNLLCARINRKGSPWNNVFIVQKRTGRHRVIVYLHDLMLFCCKNYGGPDYDYAFDSIDALMADVDAGTWDSSGLKQFAKLGLHGLSIGRVDAEDLDDVAAIVKRAIATDDVRPKLRDALDELALALKAIYDGS